jgi:hypothetical protein
LASCVRIRRKRDGTAIDLVVENQAFGRTLCYSSLDPEYLMKTEALVNVSNVTLTDKTSGILGLGFPRLSEIYGSIVNGTGILSLFVSAPQVGHYRDSVLFKFGSGRNFGLPTFRIELADK